MSLEKLKRQSISLIIMEKKIFISCPFNKFLVNNKFVDLLFREFTENLFKICSQYTPNVFLALKRENYGATPMPNYSCLRDFEEMKNTDLVIAIPEDSLGAAVELGWASAMRKDVILILKIGQNYSPLITNLPKITTGGIIWYEEDLSSILPVVRKKISNILNH